jgi:hypothetical protein
MRPQCWARAGTEERWAAESEVGGGQNPHSLAAGRTAQPCPAPAVSITPAAPKPPQAGGRVRGIPRGGPEQNTGLLQPGTALASRGPQAAAKAATGSARPGGGWHPTRDSSARQLAVRMGRQAGGAIGQVTPRVD